jgi:hypothetical protein
MSENAEKAKKLSFYEKVQQWVTGGDKRKTERFHKKFIKDNDEQIELRQKKIDDAEERKLEINEKLKESLFKIDMTEIDTIDSTNAYIPKYRKSAIAILKERKDLQTEIDTWKAEQKQFEELNNLIK